MVQARLPFGLILLTLATEGAWRTAFALPMNPLPPAHPALSAGTGPASLSTEYDLVFSKVDGTFRRMHQKVRSDLAFIEAQPRPLGRQMHGLWQELVRLDALAVAKLEEHAAARAAASTSKVKRSGELAPPEGASSKP